ncbi:MAG TPA: GNAT family N-acetyltransferase [Solirubrobacteraceae bacterium]|nr:GNAT family N-acetyltransferase [Solirubrobacteraceae bacterium]
MPLCITRDPEEFSRQAGTFLESALERNVLATVFRLSRERDAYGRAEPLYAFHLEPETGQLTAVALRTPPWPLLADGFDNPDLAAELVHQWIQYDPEVPGVTARPATAQAISAAWSRKTGGFAHRQFLEAMHILTQVIPPERAAPGQLRLATARDRDVLVGWDRQFAIETGLGTGENAERMVDIRIAARRQMVWEDGGVPVSTVGFNPEVAGTVRVGPVYTPPELRGQGYATAAVASASQMLLERGAERCMLFTDLANPISNHIYASVGYVRFGDWEQHGFHAAGGSAVTTS